MNIKNVAAVIPVVGILWLLNVPRHLGMVIITEQYLALMIGLATMIGLMVQPSSTDNNPQSTKTNIGLTAFNGLFGILCLLSWLWLAFNYEAWLLDSINRSAIKWIPAVIAIAGILEATRRHCGKVLTILAAIFITYGIYGYLAPGLFSAVETTPARYILYLYNDTNGILGLVLRVGAIQIVGFIIFGAVLNAVGGSRILTDLAMSTMGHRRGGPAKVAILASSLFGTLSGSTVANVMSTGVVTIPLMKRSGFPARYAAAIEAVASNGGQIAPPVMGATAFIIAEFLQVPYSTVVLAALLPAAAYYFMLYLQVDRYAAVNGLEGVDKSQLPKLSDSLKKSWPLIIPLGVLIYFLFGLGYAPGKAALYASIASYAFFLITAPRNVSRLAVLKEIAQTSGTMLIPVLLVSAIAGVVIGTINTTGLGFTLTLALGQIAEVGGILPLLLVTAVIAVILGVGMPTSGVYVVVSVLLAPALVKAGIGQMSAHLFIFYFGLLSMLTPPVAIASYAAASLAQSDMWQTGITGIQLAIVAYLIPFVFAFNAALLLDGTWPEIILSCITVAISGIILAEVLAWKKAYGGGLKRMGMAAFALFIGASSALFEAASVATVIASIVGAIVVVITQKYKANGTNITPKSQPEQNISS